MPSPRNGQRDNSPAQSHLMDVVEEQCVGKIEVVASFAPPPFCYDTMPSLSTPLLFFSAHSPCVRRGLQAHLTLQLKFNVKV